MAESPHMLRSRCRIIESDFSDYLYYRRSAFHVAALCWYPCCIS